jgi:hypothetical protein
LDPAGQAAEKRWRLTLTIVAWLFIGQAGLSVLTGLLGMLLSPMADPSVVFGQLGALLDRRGLEVIETLMRQTVVANQVQTLGSAVLLAGAVGLLLRKKWGWYVTVVVHIAAGVAIFIWVMPMFETLYGLLQPENAGRMALLLSLLSALIPAIVIAFLLYKPILSQFECQPAAGRPARQS